jgi:hypothetical protein
VQIGESFVTAPARSRNAATRFQEIEVTVPALVEDLVARLGLAVTVSLLAKLRAGDPDILQLSGEDLKAAVLAQDARTLGSDGSLLLRITLARQSL